MQKRSIVVMIILTFITAGLYMVYWTCSFQNQLKKKTGEGFGGFGHFFMILITFGIYSVYWQYAAGTRLAKLGATNNGLMYLIFSLIFLGWLNPYLMQSQANLL